MDLVIEKRAFKALRRMQLKKAAAIRAATGRIAADPFAPHRNVERVSGARDTFRLRVGDWRAVYHVERQAGRVVVLLIETRRQVYKR